jgi:hypothetical protein
MTSPDEVGRILLSEPEVERRLLYFGALLGREKPLSGSHLIIVGGSAIEVYTRGRYVSGDIDVVGPRDVLASVLEGWGFRKEGRMWHRADWKMAVDLVGNEYSGDLRRVREVVTPYGSVRIAAVEDLLVKRLASAKHWRIPSDIEQALLIALGYETEIDWSYVESLSSRYDVTDLLGDLRSRMGPTRGAARKQGGP